MRVIEQSHEILTDLTNPRAIMERIERAGRTCYKSEAKGTGEGARAFVKRIIAQGHLSVIEHESLSVRFITDRGVTHELVRHRLASYSQESTRYCDYEGDGVVVIRPVWLEEGVIGDWGSDRSITGPPPADREWLLAMMWAEQSYRILRAFGWQPQQARAVLPNSLKTEIVMTANFREWRHVLELRTAKAAHPQIRALMEPLRRELAQALPEVFG